MAGLLVMPTPAVSGNGDEVGLPLLLSKNTGNLMSSIGLDVPFLDKWPVCIHLYSTLKVDFHV